MERRLVLFGVLAVGGAAALAHIARLPGRSSSAPPRPDLYDCEGCEAVSERAPTTIPSDIQLADDGEAGERMNLSGRVMMPDGATPAAGVVIYAHQTNAKGLYANGSNESEWSRRHGRLRGWVKTDAQGRYRIRTIKPAPYPDMTMPAHIHLFVGEPGRQAYWIDDVVFDGEHGVGDAYRKRKENRGGSGIVRLSRDASGTWIATRDIILERHPE